MRGFTPLAPRVSVSGCSRCLNCYGDFLFPSFVSCNSMVRESFLFSPSSNEGIYVKRASESHFMQLLPFFILF